MGEISNKQSGNHERICNSLFDGLAVAAHRRFRRRRRRHGLAVGEVRKPQQEDGEKEKRPESEAIHLPGYYRCSNSRKRARKRKRRLKKMRKKRERRGMRRRTAILSLFIPRKRLVGGHRLLCFDLVRRRSCLLKTALRERRAFEGVQMLVYFACGWLFPPSLNEGYKKINI